MIGGRITIRRGGRDEGEKPFWISYADMMTALMVLFLLVMSVALLAPRAQRDDQISKIMEELEQAATKYPGIRVDKERHVVDFGSRAQFGSASWSLTSDQAQLLRSFVPKVLEVANSPEGSKWIKRIVVEGYTDRTGSYLYNLNLSLQRSQSVLCALLAPPLANEKPLTPQQVNGVRDLFVVGGYSSNSAKATLEASRRIELRIEFYGVGEPLRAAGDNRASLGTCAL